jgi:WhiB family transcriptional regulator, redox-sensing transcriptional regulator
MLSGSITIPAFILSGEPNCASVDPELFFPQEIEMSDSKVVSKYQNLSAAKAICNSCPLKLQCLEYALKNYEVGVWGGTTEHQRDDLRKLSNIKLSRRTNSPTYR